jgi:hypothetical protein
MFAQLSELSRSGGVLLALRGYLGHPLHYVSRRSIDGGRTGGSTIVRPITACSRVLGYARHRVVTRALFRPLGHSTLQDSHGWMAENAAALFTHFVLLRIDRLSDPTEHV